MVVEVTAVGGESVRDGPFFSYSPKSAQSTWGLNNKKYQRNPPARQVESDGVNVSVQDHLTGSQHATGYKEVRFVCLFVCWFFKEQFERPQMELCVFWMMDLIFYTLIVFLVRRRMKLQDTVILQIFGVVLFSVVIGFTEIKKTPKWENRLRNHDTIHGHRN